MASDDLGIIPLGVDSNDHDVRINWSPSQTVTVKSNSESVVIGGQVLLVTAPTGVQRKQLIESIDTAAGAITKNHYVVPLRQDMGEFTRQTSFLLDLLHDASDGDVIILDVDIPYYSKILDDFSCASEDQLDPVFTWDTCLKLFKRLVDDDTKTIGLVIVSATFDSRVVPRWLIDSAHTVMILDGVTSLAKASVLRNPDGERDLAADEEWIQGDPIRFQLECDGHWLSPGETIGQPLKSPVSMEHPVDTTVIDDSRIDDSIMATDAVHKPNETNDDTSHVDNTAVSMNDKAVYEKVDAVIRENRERVKSGYNPRFIPEEDYNAYKTIRRKRLAGKLLIAGVIALASAIILVGACKFWL